jgi:hypothetical protein
LQRFITEIHDRKEESVMTATAREHACGGRVFASIGAAVVCGLAALALSGGVATQSVAQAQTAPSYAANGDLLLPAGFEAWVFVGSNLGLAYRSDLKATTALESARAETPVFHNVYINPEAYSHFLRTEEFPEPTILVMEQFAAADKEPKGVLASGSYNGQRVGLEVAVKNSARPGPIRTPWAYYDFTNKADPKRPVGHAPAKADAECEHCHRDHASKDNVWVQFYPHLRDTSK